MILEKQMLAAILADMTVSTRKFLREFPIFREQAENGRTVVIESREGMKFVFHRIGAALRPRQIEKPLSWEITRKWDIDTPATAPDEWGMNR